MQEPEKLDRFLDRALGEYADGSPRSGLEQRILVNLDAQAGMRPMFKWQWVAIPAIAILAICAAVIGSWFSNVQNDNPVVVVRQHDTPTQQTSQKIANTATTSPSVRRPQSHKIRVHSLPETAQAPEPRLATFPSSAGDDEVIRLALRFAQTHPTVASQITQEQKDFRQIAEAFTAPLIRSDDQQ